MLLFWLLLSCLLTIAAPAQAGTINLAWDAPTSGGAPTGYEVHYGTASGSYSQAVDTGLARTAAITLPDGVRHYFAVLAYNGPANENESPFSNEVNAIPGSPPPPTGDTIPPTVNITSPSPGNVQRKSTVSITANASDNVGVTRVEFYIDGSLRLSDPSAPYSYQWNVPSAGGNRRYQLQVRAFDAAGNVGVSPIVEVIAQ